MAKGENGRAIIQLRLSGFLSCLKDVMNDVVMVLTRTLVKFTRSVNGAAPVWWGRAGLQ
jgi:hypothetical protein